MRRWDGKCTLMVKARVQKLQGKTITNESSPRRITASVYSGMFHKVDGLILLLILGEELQTGFYKT